MKKQLLAKLLVLALVLTLVPIAALAAGETGSNPYPYKSEAEDKDHNTVIPDTEVTPETPAEEEEAPAVEVNTTTAADGSVVASATVSTTVEGSTAVATLDTAAMTAIVEAAKDSDVVVLVVDAPKSATETTLSVPASALANLARQSKADLNVESPIATITIANADLASLASGAKTVEVTAKAVGDTIQFVVAKDGKAIDPSNGISVSIPAAAGSVIYIVNEDGTETVLEGVEFADGMAILTLPGNVTIRIA